MKYKWAVALINFFDNELKQKVVETEDNNWKAALCSAFGDYSSLDSDIKEAKEEAFNADFMFECTLISKKKDKKVKQQANKKYVHKEKELNTYTFYWLDGRRDVFKGDSPENAFTLAGFSGGALAAVDFYAEGDNKEYSWNKEARSWDKN